MTARLTSVDGRICTLWLFERFEPARGTIPFSLSRSIVYCFAVIDFWCLEDYQAIAELSSGLEPLPCESITVKHPTRAQLLQLILQQLGLPNRHDQTTLLDTGANHDLNRVGM